MARKTTLKKLTILVSSFHLCIGIDSALVDHKLITLLPSFALVEPLANLLAMANQQALMALIQAANLVHHHIPYSHHPSLPQPQAATFLVTLHILTSAWHLFQPEGISQWHMHFILIRPGLNSTIVYFQLITLLP